MRGWSSQRSQDFKKRRKKKEGDREGEFSDERESCSRREVRRWNTGGGNENPSVSADTEICRWIIHSIWISRCGFVPKKKKKRWEKRETETATWKSGFRRAARTMERPVSAHVVTSHDQSSWRRRESTRYLRSTHTGVQNYGSLWTHHEPQNTDLTFQDERVSGVTWPFPVGVSPPSVIVNVNPDYLVGPPRRWPSGVSWRHRDRHCDLVTLSYWRSSIGRSLV